MWRLEQDNKESLKRLHELFVLSDFKLERKAIDTIKRSIWKNEGRIRYSFSEGCLDRVVDQMTRIGKVPKGYLYPELLLNTTQPN